jgi:hypothetical protein
MAIGKVGSFATVEPALVDFGSMAERNIDKIKAEEQAKAAAKAKEEQAKRDAVKDIGIPDKLSFTNISEVDKSLQGTFKREWKRATEAKMGGDDRTLYDAVGTMNTLISYADQIKDTPGKIAERVEKDKTLDEDIIDIYLRDFNSLRENGYQVNTDDPRNMTISLINEKGELMNEQPLTEFIETRKVLPRKINLIDETKKVLSTIKPSVSESGSYALNTKITDINSKESKPQVEAIKENVNLWVSNNDFMWSWYKKEMAKDSKLPLKTTGWTQQEKDKAREFYTKTVIDSYNEEVEKGFGSTGGGAGGGKDKVKLTPVYGLGTTVSNNYVKKLSPDLKGRGVTYGEGMKSFDFGGKTLNFAYATSGDKPEFVFQMSDPSSVGYSGSGASAGGKNVGVDYVTTQSTDYSALLNEAKKFFGAKNNKQLASILRGEEYIEANEAEERGL